MSSYSYHQPRASVRRAARALLLVAACALAAPAAAFLPAPHAGLARARRDGARNPAARGAVSMAAEPGGGSAASSVLARLCPLLKLVANSDPTAPRNKALETATTGFASMARLPWGAEVSPLAAARAEKPAAPIRIYEFEACPFCRRVRETATYLDLELEVYPCPKDSVLHRQVVREMGGKETFPFLVDLNADEGAQTMYESADIVNYLVDTYGNGAQLQPYFLESTLLSGWMPTLFRAGRGMSRYEKASSPPEKMLVLYSYENNQFCRLVREALCELELPYKLVNAGKGSIAGRQQLQVLSGATRCPYLVDPNTDTQITDSAKIMEYLFKTYTTA